MLERRLTLIVLLGGGAESSRKWLGGSGRSQAVFAVETYVPRVRIDDMYVAVTSWGVVRRTKWGYE